MKYYHYTNVQVLYNIIKNKELWLSSPKSSNDINEYFNAFETFKDYCLLDKVLLPELKDYRFEYKSDKKVFYLSCTTAEDDASHYNNYGKNEGIAIELDEKALDRYLNDTLKLKSKNLKKIVKVFFNRHKFLEFSKVIYSKKQKFRYIDHFFEVSIDYSKYFSDDPEEKNTLLKKLTDDGLYHFSAIMKSPNHSLDKETRMIFYPDIFNNQYTFFKELNNNLIFMDENMKPLNSKYNELLEFIEKITDDLGLDKPSEYEYTNGEIREFKKINISKLINYGLIKKIYIGPKCLQDKDELTAFLFTNKVNCTVEHGNVKIKR